MTKKKAEVHIEGCQFEIKHEPMEHLLKRAEAVSKLADALKAAAEALRGPDAVGLMINSK